MVIIDVGSWRVRLLDEDEPAPDSALVVEEEDRFLVLSAPPVVPERIDHPIRVMTDLWHFEPRALGSVIEQTPRRWLAVVHDLDRDPSLDRGVAEQTLRRVLDRAEAGAAERIALRPWGVRHGPWSLDQSLEVLQAVLQERWRPRLRDLDLRSPRWLSHGSDRG